MPTVTFNLDDQITELERRVDELRQIRDMPPGETALERNRVADDAAFHIAQFEELLLALRRARANRSAASVIVEPPTEEEGRALEEALRKLSRVIQRDQTASAILTASTSVLNAANLISARATASSPTRGPAAAAAKVATQPRARASEKAKGRAKATKPAAGRSTRKAGRSRPARKGRAVKRKRKNS